MTDPTAALTQHQIRSLELMNTLWNDPEFGPKVRAKAKEKFSDIRIPEDDIEPAVSGIREENKKLADALRELQEKIAKRDEAEEQSKTMREMEIAVESAVRKYGLTEEGKAKMLDRMRETRNFTDVEAAAAFIVQSAPPAPTSGPSWAPKKMNLFGTAEAEESYRRLHQDPEGFLDSELERFARDPDRYVSEAA